MHDMTIPSYPAAALIHAIARSARQFGTVLLIAGAMALGGCAANKPAAMAPDPTPSEVQYQLGPGDKVMVNVFGDKNLSGEHQVDGTGTFTFPLIGTVQAGGLSSGQLQANLETKLKEYMRQPNVSVEILSYRPFYIVGEVRRPGSYSFVDGMTVMNAVAIAGGFTYRAQEKEFDIQRSSKSADRLGAGQATRLAPGDVIIVRERFF